MAVLKLGVGLRIFLIKLDDSKIAWASFKIYCLRTLYIQS
jgi:hypothetical protein